MKHFARKKRQLSYASKQLVILDSEGKKDSFVFQKLLHRVETLIEELRFRMQAFQLKKLLGGAILFLSMGMVSPNLHAQTPEFAAPQWDPFGLDITKDSIFALDCNFVDIDDDGDLDMLTPLYNYGDYEGTIGFDINSGSPEIPQFSGTTKSIFTLENPVFSLEIADIDNDGDYDLIISGYYGLRLIENEGTSEDYLFQTEVDLEIDGMPNAYYIRDIDFVDIDGDGDQDLLALIYESQDISYFENVSTDEEMIFQSSSLNMVNFEEDGIYYSSLDCADLDNDGDIDFFYRTFDYDTYEVKTIYLENSGTSTEPIFDSFKLEDFGIKNVTNFIYFADFQFVDIDNDGDYDFMSNGFYEYDPVNEYDFQVVYYENLAISTNTLSIESFDMEIFPNPSNDKIYINSEEKIESVSLLNSNGQLIQKTYEAKTGLSVKDVSPGIYFIQVQSKAGISTRKCLVK